MLLLNPKGSKVRLTEKEISVLRYLYRAGQRPVSRETLLQEVWGYNSGVTTHTLETHSTSTFLALSIAHDLKWRRNDSPSNGVALAGGCSPSSLPGYWSDRNEPSGCRWLFHHPRAAIKPHCRGRYLGPMNHSVDPS